MEGSRLSDWEYWLSCIKMEKAMRRKDRFGIELDNVLSLDNKFI